MMWGCMMCSKKKRNPVKVGDRFENKKGEWCTVVEYHDAQKIEVVFDGYEYLNQTFRANSLRAKSFKNSETVSYKNGNRFSNKRGEWCTVVGHEDSQNVFVVFDTTPNHTQTIEAGDLRKGSFKNYQDTIGLKGQRFKNNSGEWAEVVEYRDSFSLTIVFDGYPDYKKEVNSSVLKSGKFKNCAAPSVHGVGYSGETGSISCKNTTSIWSGMIYRCYGDNFKKKSSAYIGCSVSEEWLRLENFYQWYKTHEFYGLGYELDKDLLIRGNKVYSAETCCLIPNEINVAIVVNRKSESGLPLGVATTGNRYCSYIRYNGGDKNYLGAYDTPEEASAAYVKAKEDYIHSLAEKWHGKIEERAYQALMNWTVY